MRSSSNKGKRMVRSKSGHRAPIVEVGNRRPDRRRSRGSSQRERRKVVETGRRKSSRKRSYGRSNTSELLNGEGGRSPGPNRSRGNYTTYGYITTRPSHPNSRNGPTCQQLPLRFVSPPSVKQNLLFFRPMNTKITGVGSRGKITPT